jgi:hypothetical protein
MANEKGFFEIAKILSSKKKIPDFHSGLAYEHFLVKGWLEVSIDELEKMRIVLNGIIKHKKEMRRVTNAKLNPLSSDGNRNP